MEIGAWWDGVVEEAQIGHILAGAYWVLYPGSPSARADAFIDRLDSTCPGWRAVPFMLQVDCEKWNGDASTVPSRSEIQAFCDRLQFRLPKLKPIVYGPKWVYGDGLRGLTYPLWASSYVTGAGSFKSLYPGDSSSRWAAYSGQTPAILQYSSSATVGGQPFSDANAFRGTRAQLTALVAPGWSSNVATLDAEDLTNIAAKVWGYDVDPSSSGYTAGGALWTTLGRSAELNALPDQIGALPTAEENAQAFIAALAGQSVAEIAAALKAVLGDQAAAVGAALQADALLRSGE